MRNIVTQGRVKGANIIEVQTDILSSLINQEVTVIIRKKEKSLHIQELIDDMMTGRNMGYRRIRRDEIYRT
jgi:hypothetical protein